VEKNKNAMKRILIIAVSLISILIIGGYFCFKIYFSPERIKERQIKTWTERVKMFAVSKDSVLSTNVDFIEDSILKRKFRINLKQYLKPSLKCPPLKYKKKELIDEFEGFQNIGDIDKDGKDDFVFVLRPLNVCEDGDSYYFSNLKIPRIETDSYCCHPYNIFSIGDIDEDGSNEIAQYYSSCASRFKHFKIWTLKNNQWKEIAEINYAVNEEYKQFKDFHKLYRKTGKNEFQFLEISDVLANGKAVKEWKTVVMK